MELEAEGSEHEEMSVIYGEMEPGVTAKVKQKVGLSLRVCTRSIDLGGPQKQEAAALPASPPLF